MCFLAAQYHTRFPKHVSFSLSRGTLPSILYLSLSFPFSLSLFSRSLPIWRPPFSLDLEAVGLQSNVVPGSRARGHRRARQLSSCLASLSLSLHYDAKRGDGGGATVGRGPRLVPPEVTDAVEWVLRHFFWPN
jgi:hypothetical protein